MPNTEEVVVPYVTTAARLSFDALVAAYRKVQPDKSVNHFLTDTFAYALKDPALRHDGTKDLQIKHFGRAYLLDNADERLFGSDYGVQGLLDNLKGATPERPKKVSRCCRSDWLQAIIRGGVHTAESVERRTFVQTWGEEFLSMADQHHEGRAPLVNRFREVFRVICGTPDLIDLMGLLKRQRVVQELPEAPDISVDTAPYSIEDASYGPDPWVPQPVEVRPPSVPPPEITAITFLENPYDLDWQWFKGHVNDWPRIFIMDKRVFFIARTYLNELHRRVYEGGHLYTHKSGRREKQNIHDLPLMMQLLETGGRLEMKYTVTCLEADEAIGTCGKIWKNIDGSGDEISLYRWFIIVKDPHQKDRVPVLHLVTQSQFNRFSEARLNDPHPPQPTV